MMKIITDGITTHLYEDEKKIKNVTEIKFEHKSGSDPILIWKENGIFHNRTLAGQMDKKFKVGDKVRFKEDYLNSHTDGYSKEYLDKVITIKELCTGGYLTEDNDGNEKYWFFVDDVFELVEDDKKMRNIDIIANDNRLNNGNYYVCEACYFLKNNKECSDCHDSCEFETVKGCFDFLQAEYKRPKIKLTKFEYDLLKTYDDLGARHFKYVYILSTMKAKGYFKNVDTSRTIKDILENCEVIDE